MDSSEENFPSESLGTLLLMILVVATFLFLLIWLIFGGTASELVTRIGIGLEIIGLLAIVPEIIGAGRLGNIQQKLENIDFQNNKSCITTVAFILMSFVLICSYVVFSSSHIRYLPSERDPIIFWALIGAFWILFLIILCVYSYLSRPISQFVTRIFEGLTFVMSIATSPFLVFLLEITEKFIYAIQMFLGKYSLKSLILGITVPLTFLGNCLQFIATYL